uniref:ATP-dependent DNA helicase n=1 Tax=Octopus bimaculoides TaxID=37653 RepID=A0A0L8HNH0_OCTBM
MFEKSVIWHECEVLHLITNMRVQNCLSINDTTTQARLAYHSVWLLQIGDGRIPNVKRQFGMPPHIIKLKMGVLIMLLRNLDQRNGHCNGARYSVLSVSDNMITASKITGVDAGRTLLIPRIIQQPSDTDLPFSLKRRQFPVKPAFNVYLQKSRTKSF